jgi:hypothetical protein
VNPLSPITVADSSECSLDDDVHGRKALFLLGPQIISLCRDILTFVDQFRPLRFAETSVPSGEFAGESVCLIANNIQEEVLTLWTA